MEPPPGLSAMGKIKWRRERSAKGAASDTVRVVDLTVAPSTAPAPEAERHGRSSRESTYQDLDSPTLTHHRRRLDTVEHDAPPPSSPRSHRASEPNRAGSGGDSATRRLPDVDPLSPRTHREEAPPERRARRDTYTVPEPSPSPRERRRRLDTYGDLPSEPPEPSRRKSRLDSYSDVPPPQRRSRRDTYQEDRPPPRRRRERKDSFYEVPAEPPQPRRSRQDTYRAGLEVCGENCVSVGTSRASVPYLAARTRAS